MSKREMRGWGLCRLIGCWWDPVSGNRPEHRRSRRRGVRAAAPLLGSARQLCLCPACQAGLGPLAGQGAGRVSQAHAALTSRMSPCGPRPLGSGSPWSGQGLRACGTAGPTAGPPLAFTAPFLPGQTWLQVGLDRDGRCASAAHGQRGAGRSDRPAEHSVCTAAGPRNQGDPKLPEGSASKFFED